MRDKNNRNTFKCFSILICLYYLLGVNKVGAQSTDLQSLGFAKKIFESVKNYKHGMVEGIKAIDSIINDELPNSCKRDQSAEKFKEYLEAQACNQELFSHLSTLNKLDADVSSIIDQNKGVKNLDQWIWMREGLKKKKGIRMCQMRVLEKSDYSQMKPKIKTLQILRTKIKASEQKLMDALKSEKSIKKLFKRRDLVSKCLSVDGKLMQAILLKECPSTSNLEIYGNGFFNSVNEGALCRKAFSQNKNIKHQIGTRFNRKNGEEYGALRNRCFVETLAHYNNNEILRDPQFSQSTKKLIDEYTGLKSSQKSLLDLDPILKSDEITAVVGIASHMDINKSNNNNMFKKAFSLAVKKQKKRLDTEIKELGTAINSRSTKQRSENMSNYDLLKHLDGYYFNTGKNDEWNNNMSCHMYIRYLREGGIKEVKKLALDMLVVAAPLGVSLVLKEILIARNLLTSLNVTSKYSKLTIPILKQTLKKSRYLRKGTSNQILLSEVLAETYSIKIDIGYLENEYRRCEKVVTDFNVNGKCRSSVGNNKDFQKEYDECRGFVDEAVQTMIMASIGGVFTLSSGTKSFLKKLEKRSSTTSKKSLRNSLDDLGHLHESKKGVKYMGKYNQNNKYDLTNRKDELYFVGIVDLIRKDLKSKKVKNIDIEVEKQLDEIMKTCKK